MYDVAGLVIIVTGAAVDVGRALALGFAEAGAQVIAIDADRAGLADLGFASQGRVLAITADVQRDDDVANVVKIALDRHGRIDALITTPADVNYGDLLARPAADWSRAVAATLTGAARCIRAVLPNMLERGHGRVVVVASAEAEECTRGASAYAAANAGLIALARTLAKEIDRGYSPDVLINALLVGPSEPGDRAARRQPEAAYPRAHRLITYPAAGPSGRLFAEGLNDAIERDGDS